MWLVLAFVSAALLGFYDVFKKKSLKGNAVIPVLFLNTHKTDVCLDIYGVFPSFASHKYSFMLQN